MAVGVAVLVAYGVGLAGGAGWPARRWPSFAFADGAGDRRPASGSGRSG